MLFIVIVKMEHSAILFLKICYSLTKIECKKIYEVDYDNNTYGVKLGLTIGRLGILYETWVISLFENVPI